MFVYIWWIYLPSIVYSVLLIESMADLRVCVYRSNNLFLLIIIPCKKGCVDVLLNSPYFSSYMFFMFMRLLFCIVAFIWNKLFIMMI